MAGTAHPTGERLALFAINLDEIRCEAIPLRLALADPVEADVVRNVCVNLAEAQDLIDELLERRRARVSKR
jgi:hypothetical protein